MGGSNYRKAIFVVVYSKDKENKIKYVILKRKLHWKGWEFPKGGVENNESKFKCAKREVLEETGLRARRIKDFNIHGKYEYRKKHLDRNGIIGQTYSLLAAEVKYDKIQIDKHEHYYGEWMEIDKAVKVLTHENQKRLIKVVDNWISKQK